MNQSIDAQQAAAPEAVPRSDARGWYAVAVLSAVYTLSYADRMLMSLLIRPIKADLGLTDLEVSLLLGLAFAAFYALMGVPFGILGDRVNRRNMIAAGVTAWSAMTGLCAFAGSFASLFIGRMGVGVGEASLAPCAYSMISDYFDRHRLGRAIAIYALGMPVGTGLALIFGGSIVQALAATPLVAVPGLGEVSSWRIAFGVLALAGIPFVLLVLTMREPPRRKRATDAQLPRGAMRAYMRANAALIVLYFGGVSMFSVVAFGTMAWTPTFFVRSFGMDAGEVGILYGVISLFGGVIGLLAGGTLGDILFRRWRPDGHLLLLIGAAVLTFPFFVAIPLMPTATLAFALLVPATIVWTVSNALSTTILQLFSPPEMRGRMTALFLLANSLIGLGCGPTFVAAITDKVLRDEARLNISLSILAIGLPISALLMALSAKPLRRALAEQAR